MYSPGMKSEIKEHVSMCEAYTVASLMSHEVAKIPLGKVAW